MPKPPLVSRSLLYELLTDGTIHQLDFCLVTHQTLGQMVEWRSITKRPGDDIKDEDLFDSNFTDILRVSAATPTGNYALDQLLERGSQWPHYRANDPGVK
jgi:hypothetical protein